MTRVSQYAGTCVHTCRGRKPTSDAIPQASLPLLEMESLTGLELAKKTTLTGHRAVGIFLSLLHQVLGL